MHRIFIGWDESEAKSAELLAWSLRKFSSEPLDIKFLKTDELVRDHGFHLSERGGATAFSYTRFAVPWLCNYKGLALFMDCDMLCTGGDVSEVFHLPMEGLAIRCTQHDFTPTTDTKMWGVNQKAYPRKLWSSFMLLNCPLLTTWTKTAVERWHGSGLHQFEDIPDNQIGAIDLRWNEVGELKPDTKLFHWTEKNPCHNPDDYPHPELWESALQEYTSEANRDVPDDVAKKASEIVELAAPGMRKIRNHPKRGVVVFATYEQVRNGLAFVPDVVPKNWRPRNGRVLFILHGNGLPAVSEDEAYHEWPLESVLAK